eukprot:TRINITY_DN3481_c0_g1_i2.p1 TRINITY_DN3481_c0_g1~~TRINITY_DN3481_c0_g1_i2.p1  ORF type:complete len:322 (+),score=50.46 TRINITY_DN3481_c0_g1_i2:73-966(+)
MAVGMLTAKAPAKPFYYSDPTQLPQWRRRGIRQCRCQTSLFNGANYRPAVILPGLGNSSNDYKNLASTLESRGIHTIIAKVSRLDWLRNAAGLLDPNYWKGTLHPSPVLDWYIERIQEAVSEATLQANGQKISLLGHSAGGWLARIYMANFGMDQVSLLLTLGTPHQYIKGERLIGSFSTDSMRKPKELAMDGGDLTGTSREQRLDVITENVSEKPSYMSANLAWRARIVGQGYKQVCGRADVWGDGIVPEISAHLEGATNISLDGVYHSPVGSDDISRPWYGSSVVIDKWIHHLLE